MKLSKVTGRMQTFDFQNGHLLPSAPHSKHVQKWGEADARSARFTCKPISFNPARSPVTRCLRGTVANGGAASSNKLFRVWRNPDQRSIRRRRRLFPAKLPIGKTPPHHRSDRIRSPPSARNRHAAARPFARQQLTPPLSDNGRSS